MCQWGSRTVQETHKTVSYFISLEIVSCDFLVRSTRKQWLRNPLYTGLMVLLIYYPNILLVIGKQSIYAVSKILSFSITKNLNVLDGRSFIM